MLGNQPLISVIVPAYNSEKYIAEALQSVLDQNYKPMEIIVVDDGSTDKTTDIVAGFESQVEYVYMENSGPGAARNRGLELAAGDIVGFIDADDLWDKNKLKLQLPFLLEDSSIDIVLGALQRFGHTPIFDNKKNFEIQYGPETCYSFGTALMRKSIFDKIGKLEPEMRLAEDTDWFLRARDLDINIFLHDDVVLHYRMHKTNLSSKREVGNSYLLNALQKSIYRRRKKGN